VNNELVCMVFNCLLLNTVKPCELGQISVFVISITRYVAVRTSGESVESVLEMASPASRDQFYFVNPFLNG